MSVTYKTDRAGLATNEWGGVAIGRVARVARNEWHATKLAGNSVIPALIAVAPTRSRAANCLRVHGRCHGGWSYPDFLAARRA